MTFDSTARLHALSCVWLFAIPWTVACQVPLSMGFSKQEYWSGLPFPSLGDLSDPGIECMFSALAGGFFAIEPPGKPLWFKTEQQKEWGKWRAYRRMYRRISKEGSRCKGQGRNGLDYSRNRSSQMAIVIKNPPANAGDVGEMSSIPG